MPEKMVRGQEFYLGWRFKWADSTPKNLTGFSVSIQIRPFKNSRTILASYSEVSPQVLFMPNNGAIDFRLSPVDTAAFDFKKAVVDCWVRNATDGDRSPTTEIIFDTGVSR